MSKDLLNTPETVLLKIDGQVFDSWKTISLTRSLNTLCASFQLSLIDLDPGRVDRSVITDQAACEIWLRGPSGKDELFLTGYIGEVNNEIGETSHSITVSGRDRTGDLIDCAAIHATGKWNNARLETIARDILKPFGLTLKVNATTGATFATFCLEQGESAFEALTRLTKMRGLLLDTSEKGEVVIFEPTAERSRTAAFELGRNIKTIKFRSSSAQRFSSYTIKGQHRGGNFVSAKAAASPKGTATDPGIGRYRPLIIISNEQSTAGALKTRALYEAASRIGNAQEVNISVKGWRDDAGVLIRPNTIARVLAPYAGIEPMDMMIADVSLDLSDSTTASIRMVRPEAYTTEDLIEAKKKKGRKKKTGATEASWLAALVNE